MILDVPPLYDMVQVLFKAVNLREKHPAARLISLQFYDILVQSLASKVGQDERSFVDLLVVVLAELVLLLSRPGTDRLLEVALGILAADHEADLAGGVGRDGGVGVLDVGEDGLAVLLELGNEGKMEPLVLGCRG